MRLLVTGATGFLGRRLVTQGLASGHAVVALRHRSEPRGIHDSPVLGGSIEWIAGDLTTAGAIDALAAAGPFDAIVHTAYVQRGPALVPLTAEAPRRLATMAAGMGAHLVHLSSDLVFGGRPEPYAEHDEPAPVSAYGEAKAHAEEAVRASGAEALIVRTSLLYAKPHDADTGPQEALAADPTVRFFTNEVRCPAAADDVAAALLAAIDLRATGTWHLVGADPVDRLEFARRLALARGLDPPTQRGTPTTAEAATRPGRLVLRSRTPLPGVREILRG
jgi:dTDP-4-dehydrorhamnose reductase